MSGGTFCAPNSPKSRGIGHTFQWHRKFWKINREQKEKAVKIPFTDAAAPGRLNATTSHSR